ncbi:hypothetical protein FQZ97_1083280 [compost metagenome]
MGQIGLHVAAVVLEQQTIPLAQRVVVEVQAGVFVKVGRAQQLARLFALDAAVGPTVQGAHDVATRAAAAGLQQVAPSLEDDGLPVAADVGDQLDAAGGAHQSTSARFLRQCVVVPWVGDGELVPHIPGPALEEDFLFALEQRFVEVTGNLKLACGLLQLKT